MKPDGLESHCATAICDVPAQQALAFLADGLALGHWALGSWATQPVGNGVVRGTSLFDDQPTFVRPVADAARMAVDYHVGSHPDALTPRISAMVEPLAALDAGTGRCRISLHATRAAGMDDARWLRLTRCHEVEVLLIQARLALTGPGQAAPSSYERSLETTPGVTP